MYQSRKERRSRTGIFSTALVAVTLAAASGAAPRASHAAAPFTGAAVQVNGDTSPPSPQQETTIAVNPTNPRSLVAGSITWETGVGQSAAYASTDGGRTWTHQVLPNGGSLTAAGDPVVAFDANGTAYFLSMNCDSTCGNRTQYLYRSSDGGQKWDAPTLAITSPNTASDQTGDDKGALAVDDNPSSPYAGNIYVAAIRNPGTAGDLRFARSTNGGLGFDPDLQVDDDTAIAFPPSVAVGADGAVYVAWGNVVACALGGGCTTSIRLEKSTNGGASFGALSSGVPHTIAAGDIADGGEVRPYARLGGPGVIAAHPTDPNIVYAVWSENVPGIDDSDVMFSRSLDGGNTWQQPIRVNDDVNPQGEYFSQFMPMLGVDPSDGEVDVVWYSDQNDPNRTDGTALVDLYFASSTDDGATFGHSVRVTSASSSLSRTPPVFFGDYVGIDSFGGVAHPIWADTTLGGDGDMDAATTQIGGADLQIAKTDLLDPAVAGGKVVYRITVTNDGPADAFNGIVKDTLPVGVTFVHGADPCAAGPAPGTLTCYLDKSLPAGATESFDITLAIDPDLVYKAGAPVTLTNTAAVRSDQVDPNPSDNSTSETTLVNAVADAAIVSFAPVAPPAQVLVGQPVALTLRKVVMNHGPSAPVDVRVSGSATAPAGSTVTPVTLTSTVAALGKNELRTIDESYTITCGSAGLRTFTFGNAIQLARPADTDPDLTNNTSVASVTVECVLPVALNIKPGGLPNALNLNGTAPVAVLTTSLGDYGLPLAFDATRIDPATVRFGPASLVFSGSGGASAIHGTGHLEDSYELDEKTRDGDLDMVLQFRVADSGLTTSSTEACVSGKYVGADAAVHTFFGCDSVKVSP